MWFGRIGEFIVFTNPLGYAEECELLAYLRKKWLGKGDGSATPPGFLSGNYGTPSLAEAKLACADGTAVVVEGAPVALGALQTTGTVDWTRTWDGLAAANAALFSVAGDVSLGTVNLDLTPKPTQDALVLDWGGAALTTPTWTVTSDGGATGAKVSTRGTSYWISNAGIAIYLR